jgi:hypothetical protein
MAETKKPKKTPATPKSLRTGPNAIRAKPPRKRAAGAVLADAPPDKCFWVNCGPILRNLRELGDALANGISEEQFAYHVVGDRNDFAVWVQDVLGDVACAEALRRARTRQAALRAVDARL